MKDGDTIYYGQQDSEQIAESIAELIHGCHLKAEFLNRHRSLLSQLDYDSVDNTRDGSWSDMTYVSVEPHPYSGVLTLEFNVYGPESRKVMGILRKAFSPGKWDKDATGYHFKLTKNVDGLKIVIESQRDNVCKRVVTGTTTRVVPAVEAQPERVVEDEEVEWVCGNLAGEDSDE